MFSDRNSTKPFSNSNVNIVNRTVNNNVFIIRRSTKRKVEDCTGGGWKRVRRYGNNVVIGTGRQVACCICRAVSDACNYENCCSDFVLPKEMFIKEAEDLTLRSVLERSTRQYDFLVDSLGVAGGVTQLQDSYYIDLHNCKKLPIIRGGKGGRGGKKQTYVRKQVTAEKQAEQGKNDAAKEVSNKPKPKGKTHQRSNANDNLYFSVVLKTDDDENRLVIEDLCKENKLAVKVTCPQGPGGNVIYFKCATAQVCHESRNKLTGATRVYRKSQMDAKKLNSDWVEGVQVVEEIQRGREIYLGKLSKVASGGTWNGPKQSDKSDGKPDVPAQELKESAPESQQVSNSEAERPGDQLNNQGGVDDNNYNKQAELLTAVEENEETGNDAAEFVFPDIISEVLGITRERENGFVSATVLGEWRNCDSKSLCRRFRCAQGEGELSLEVVLRGRKESHKFIIFENDVLFESSSKIIASRGNKRLALHVTLEDDENDQHVVIELLDLVDCGSKLGKYTNKCFYKAVGAASISQVPVEDHHDAEIEIPYEHIVSDNYFDHQGLQKFQENNCLNVTCAGDGITVDSIFNNDILYSDRVLLYCEKNHYYRVTSSIDCVLGDKYNWDVYPLVDSDIPDPILNTGYVERKSSPYFLRFKAKQPWEDLNGLFEYHEAYNYYKKTCAWMRSNIPCYTNNKQPDLGLRGRGVYSELKHRKTPFIEKLLVSKREKQYRQTYDLFKFLLKLTLYNKMNKSHLICWNVPKVQKPSTDEHFHYRDHQEFPWLGRFSKKNLIYDTVVLHPSTLSRPAIKDLNKNWNDFKNNRLDIRPESNKHGELKRDDDIREATIFNMQMHEDYLINLKVLGAKFGVLPHVKIEEKQITLQYSHALLEECMGPSAAFYTQTLEQVRERQKRILTRFSHVNFDVHTTPYQSIISNTAFVAECLWQQKVSKLQIVAEVMDPALPINLNSKTPSRRLW